MFEKPGPHCPVASFERYIQHLNPSNKFLFQRPKKNAGISDQVWYDNMVVGERLLGEKMKRILLSKPVLHQSLDQGNGGYNPGQVRVRSKAYHGGERAQK